MSYRATGYNATQMQANDGHSLAKARDKAKAARNNNTSSKGSNSAGYQYVRPYTVDTPLDMVLNHIRQGN